MIRVTCPRCQSKLNAKEELLGQVRKCPKCGTAVRIESPDAENLSQDPSQAPAPQDPRNGSGIGSKPQPSPLATAGEPADAASEAEQPATHAAATATVGLPTKDVPERLDRQNHYLICDKSKLVATWENNGHGWMLKSSFGKISASRNNEQVPSQGDFKLIELKLTMTDDGLQLIGIRTYQLAKRWALTNLERGDDKILTTVTGPGFLNRDQKSVVRNLIKEQYMRHVWEHADNVLTYLGNTDFHSPGVW